MALDEEKAAHAHVEQQLLEKSAEVEDLRLQRDDLHCQCSDLTAEAHVA